MTRVAGRRGLNEFVCINPYDTRIRIGTLKRFTTAHGNGCSLETPYVLLCTISLIFEFRLVLRILLSPFAGCSE